MTAPLDRPGGPLDPDTMKRNDAPSLSRGRDLTIEDTTGFRSSRSAGGTLTLKLLRAKESTVDSVHDLSRLGPCRGELKMRRPLLRVETNTQWGKIEIRTKKRLTGSVGHAEDSD